MAFTETLTERFAFGQFLPFSNHASNTDSQIAGFDMSKIRRLMAIIEVGVVAAGGNVTAWWVASAYSNMSGQTNVDSAVAHNAVNTANRLYTMEVRADQLPAGTRYVRPLLTIGGATVNLGVHLIGDESAYKPGNQFTVANQVAAADVV